MPALESPAMVRPAQTRGGIDPVVSERIAMVRFPLIIGVVLTHSGWGIYAQGNSSLPIWQNYIGMLMYEVLPRSAVPLFTFLSGYLYFRNYMGRSEDFFAKNTVRIRTLMTPYVIWNILAVFMMLFLHALRGTPNVIGCVFPDETILGIIETLGLSGIPPASQFWFVRNLMFLCLISPLLYLALRRRDLGVAVTVAGMLLWLVGITAGAGVDFQSTIAYSLAFFCWGGCMSIHNVDLRDLGSRVALVGWCVADCKYWNVQLLLPKRGAVLLADWPIRCVRVLGCMALWTAFSKAQRIKQFTLLLLWLSPISFFVFSIHFPFIQVPTHRLFYCAQAHGLFWVDMHMFVAPVIVLSMAVCIALLLRKYCPGVLSLLSGQRGTAVGGRGDRVERPIVPDCSSALRH